MNAKSVLKLYYSLFLNKTQHVSEETPPIIRSLKLHKQPLVLHAWKVVGREVVGCCQVAHYLTTPNNCMSDNLPQYYAKPEAACAVLGS
jgi:hypothetical protein